jgi:F-type H+-transporting ATPase subunit delta
MPEAPAPARQKHQNMAGMDKKDEAVAHAYASAMFDVAEAAGQADLLLHELADLAAYLQAHEDFRRFVTQPAIDAQTRRHVFEKLLRGKYSDILVDSLQVLNRRELLPQIADAYYHLHEAARGRIEVLVTTPVPLDDRLRERVTRLAGGYTGRQVDLVERMDESLIAGLVLQIGDRKFDASVQRRLERLHEVLLERASKELHAGKKYAEGAAV